jgi:site-specific DNA-methyltransferase (adenine-specific)
MKANDFIPYAFLIGDCIEVLAGAEVEEVDAVVTDPPAGIGFMGKEWDDFRRARNPNDTNRDNVFGRQSARGPEIGRRSRDAFVYWLKERLCACYRVLKPGGHILVWAIPRTSHWTGLAIEDAGFEVRDRVSHFYGQGFPKGGMVSKNIDKRLGVEPTIIGENPNHRPVSGVEYEGVYAGGNTGSKHLTTPTSSEAKQWDGWASNLKPACEDWWLARKPFKGSLVSNILKYGTGALNIEACRILTDEKLTRKLGKTTESDSGWKSVKRSEIAGKEGGRWPANITFDAEAAAMLDEQSGNTKPHGKPARTSRYGGMFGNEQKATGLNQYEDAGGASRFFYCAKATKKERNAGLLEGTDNDHPTVKSIELMRWLIRLITPPGGVVLDPFMGSGSTGVASVQEGFEFVGIDEDAHYVDLAKQRIEYAWKLYLSSASSGQP